MKGLRPGCPAERALDLPWRDVELAARSTLSTWCRLWRITLRIARTVPAACGAFEWVAFGYLGLTGALVAVFHAHLAGPAVHLVLRAGIVLVLIALSLAAHRHRSRGLRFARCWYPHLFFLFCFEELHYLVRLVFPGWLDGWLIRFDHAITGVHPTVWLEQFARPWLNDLMQAAYITYFFYLIVLGAVLYVQRERRAYWEVMTCSVMAYTIGYLIAIVFPAESPYHSLAALQHGPLVGGPATALINLVERFGRVHGAAFPSAHVSGSLVALLGAWRYRRRLFWIYLPPFLCMLAATVYGRYHYVADVLGGLLIGFIGDFLGRRLMRSAGALPEVAE